MIKPVRLRLAGRHERELRAHLFPGDGKEAVAFALCGRHRGLEHDFLLVQDVRVIPYADCPVREPDRITWRTDALEPILAEAANRGLGVVKFHSHPTAFASFSPTDDRSDRDLFPSIYGWVDDDGPHASVVQLPDGRMFGRSVGSDGAFEPLDQIAVAAESITLFAGVTGRGLPGHAQRHAQLFGTATAALLRRLAIGVVGCSGTGSFVIEMLARLGTRRLVLVDPDRVEYRNLNRIVGATASDAALLRPKVDVLAESVARMGLGTEVTRVADTVASREAVAALAGCDVVFGCVDSHDGRRTLNRLAAFYLLPYFDCGVGLEADGAGGIDQICAASHYLQPGASNVIERGIVRQKQAEAEAMARANPELYAKLRAEKYIAGVEEDRPAVVTVNALAASLAVNELLARVHHYRDDPDDRYASVRFSLSQMHLYTDHETHTRSAKRELGRGDVEPLLDMPELSREPTRCATPLAGPRDRELDGEDRVECGIGELGGHPSA